MPNRSITDSRPDFAARKSALLQLGRALALFGSGTPWPGHSCGLTEEEYTAFDRAIRQARVRNGWFTEENVRHALLGTAHLLRPEAVDAWLGGYPLLGGPHAQRTVGVIMAGNIPFVGFHDLLCILLVGHRAVVKVSSDDAGLTPALLDLLAAWAPQLAGLVRLSTGKLGEIDALIATGSDNTARYFEHYFGHVPRIIRKGRTSVAVLDGSETDAELAAFGEDVFRYFGLGCRNVGKVHIPMDFDLDRLFGAFFRWKDIINHNKYANNYDYNKAVWLLDRASIIENGFLIMKEETALHGPVASLYYERYTEPAEVLAGLQANAAKIQCIVGHGHVPFGEGQFPGPEAYADNVDTLEFLLRPAYSVAPS